MEHYKKYTIEERKIIWQNPNRQHPIIGISYKGPKDAKKIDLAGLNEDMKTYINTQKPKTISEVIHHSLVAAKIFVPNKGFVKPQDNGDKNSKDRSNKDAKAIGNKDHSATNGKKKEPKEYKGQNKLSLVEIEKYRKENARGVHH